MTLLLQISDPHFGTERPAVVEALVRLVRRLRPDLLVLSGDITQRATSTQFAAARAFVERLQIERWLAIPGNHDIPLFNPFARWLWPYARQRRYFGDDLEPAFESPELLLLMLNTTRRYRHVDGELSPAQIERVARRLEAAAPRQVRIVVTHQPLAVSREQDRHNLLHGHAAAVRRWADAGADLLLGGHIHLPSVMALHRHGPPLARPLWAVQAGTAVSQRIRHGTGNSVNLIRISATATLPSPAPRHAELIRCDYRDADDEFVTVLTQPIELGIAPGAAAPGG